jgi:hypothetical protein
MVNSMTCDRINIKFKANLFLHKKNEVTMISTTDFFGLNFVYLISFAIFILDIVRRPEYILWRTTQPES